MALLQNTNIIRYLSKEGNNLFKAVEEIKKNKQYIERITTNNDILYIEYTKGNPSLFRFDIEFDRPEYERDGNGFVLDSEICAYYCIDFINCLESWVMHHDRAYVMDIQVKPSVLLLDKGFECVNLIRQYSTNNPFSLLYCSIIECYKVIQSYYPEFIPKKQTAKIKPELKSLTREFTCTEQEILFKELKDGGFIAKNTNYSHFCAVFGNTPIPEKDQPFKPLEWIKKSDVTKEKSLCKRSLLDLLQILGIRETDIKEICKNSFKNYKGHHFVNDKKTKELKTHSQFHDDLLKIKDRLSD